MKRILLVEDEKAIRKLIRFKLSKMGHEILEAADGREGVEIAAKEPLDLILLDVMMPHLDGIEALREIRTRGARPEVPVVMVTARKDPEDEQAAREMGVEHFLYKPFRTDDLKGIVEKILG